MTIHAILVAIPLGLGVLVCLVACLGVLRMRHPLDRLHYVTIACTTGPFLIVVAALVEDVSAVDSINSVLILAVLAVTSPFSTHAIARAIRARDTGALAPEPDELARGVER